MLYHENVLSFNLCFLTILNTFACPVYGPPIKKQPFYHWNKCTCTLYNYNYLIAICIYLKYWIANCYFATLTQKVERTRLVYTGSTETLAFWNFISYNQLPAGLKQSDPSRGVSNFMTNDFLLTVLVNLYILFFFKYNYVSLRRMYSFFYKCPKFQKLLNTYYKKYSTLKQVRKKD